MVKRLTLLFWVMVMGSGPAGSKILFLPKQHIIVQNPSYSYSNLPDMIERHINAKSSINFFISL